MQNALDTLLARGFVQQVTDEAALRKALAGGPLVFYAGYDPTATSFHVGNLVPIFAMSHLQRAGHKPIVIIGGGTGLIGDPSGKVEERALLTRDRVAANAESLRRQFARFLAFDGPNAATIIDNGDWIAPLVYVDFLREIGRHFRVNIMIKAEGYRQRLEREQGLSLIEFNYQVLQAFDFLVLNQRHGCTLQMGGSDQWGNIVAGVDLVRRVEGKDVFGLTFPLITTASGQKMGKSEEGAVWLDAERTPPFSYFQFWRNADDRDVARFLRLFTFLPLEEIARATEGGGGAINEAKKTLAFEATRLAHGDEAAAKARDDAASLFSGQGGAAGGAAPPAESVPSFPVPRAELDEGVLLVDALVRAGLASSKSDARRLVQSGGAYVGGSGEAVQDLARKLGPADAKDGAVLLRAGKKRWARLVVEG